MNKKEYVLITGVSSGIGNDAVGYLIEQGYHVLGSVRKESDEIKLTAQYPNNFTCLQFDVTKKEEVVASLEIVKKVLNGSNLKALVNNAGLALVGPLEIMDDDKFRYQMEVNVFSVRTVTNVFLPLLKGSKEKNIPGGKIIMISSISGVFNTPFNGAYCISKHAMESIGETYRRELMMYNIDVVSIQPGPIASKLWDKSIDKYEEFKSSEYGNLVNKASKVMEGAEKDALPAIVISKLIHKILIKKRTKLAFIVIKNKWFITFLVKYVPARIVDKFIYKQFFK